MNEDINIISLVLAKLDNNDMWFTTKADPTVEEARSYYKLDDYGDLTEKAVAKIEKQVKDLVGDGAIDIYDAVDLWVNDALVAHTVDFKDNLVTKFKDKPVVDNIEAYKNPIQFAQSKKVESRKIIEGVLKNIQLEDEIDEWKVYSADVDTKLGKNIIATFKNYEDDEGNVITNIRIDYNTANNKYIVNYVDNDGRFHQIDYKLSDDELSQIAGNKKVEAKTKKTEGAGAGYNVSGTLTNIRVNSYEVVDEYVDNSDYGGQEKCFVLKCDIDVDIEDMKFSSYEYGGEIEFPVKAKITNLVLFDYDYDEDSSENVELDEAGIIGALEDITFEDVLGAGWVHQAFTGTFETSIDGSSYSVLTADNCTISIDNEKVIDYIDNKVTGNIDLYTYAVLDEEGEELKDDFSDEEEAIKYAQEHNGVKVARIYHNWKLIGADGSLDDEPENEVIWERDYDKHYKYDNEVNESKKVTEEFWEDGEKYEYKGIVIQQSISDKGKKIYSILNRQEPFSIPDFSSLRAAKQYIDNNNLKSYRVTENYQKRLDEVNNKSKDLISNMFSDNSFDSDSPAGQIIMRTSEMFNALSDKGYDVEVTFDNGESTSAVQLGKQGGKVVITITNANQPLRAFATGNFEIIDENIQVLEDIKSQIEAL